MSTTETRNLPATREQLSKRELARVTPISNQYTPPADAEAEQSVIGAIMVRPEGLLAISEDLVPEDFYREAHGKVFQAMLDLSEKNEPVDLVSVSALLRERGQLESVGGPGFLAGLSEQVGFATNVCYYAKVVKNKSRIRRLLDKAQEIAAACFSPIENTQEFFDRVSQDIYSVCGSDVRGETKGIEELVERESKVIEASHYSKSQPGVSTGYIDLDRLVKFNPGELTLLAARPSMGKTALAINFLLKAADQNVPGGIFSIETSKEIMARRFMSNLGRIDGHRLNRGALTPEEWVRFAGLPARVEALPIWVDESPGLSIVDMRARTRRLYAAGKCSFLVVDYLQLTRPVRRGRSRDEEVGEFSRGLKALSKELGIPVVAISSLNRKCEERSDKRPNLGDLRESGALEFDADVVMFLYNDELYHPNTKDKGISEVRVAKNKNGPLGTVKLQYERECFRFENLVYGPTQGGIF